MYYINDLIFIFEILLNLLNVNMNTCNDQPCFLLSPMNPYNISMNEQITLSHDL